MKLEKSLQMAAKYELRNKWKKFHFFEKDKHKPCGSLLILGMSKISNSFLDQQDFFANRFVLMH